MGSGTPSSATLGEWQPIEDGVNDARKRFDQGVDEARRLGSTAACSLTHWEHVASF